MRVRPLGPVAFSCLFACGGAEPDDEGDPSLEDPWQLECTELAPPFGPADAIEDPIVFLGPCGGFLRSVQYPVGLEIEIDHWLVRVDGTSEDLDGVPIEFSPAGDRLLYNHAGAGLSSRPIGAPEPITLGAASEDAGHVRSWTLPGGAWVWRCDEDVLTAHDLEQEHELASNVVCWALRTARYAPRAVIPSSANELLWVDFDAGTTEVVADITTPAPTQTESWSVVTGVASEATHAVVDLNHITFGPPADLEVIERTVYSRTGAHPPVSVDPDPEAIDWGDGLTSPLTCVSEGRVDLFFADTHTPVDLDAVAVRSGMRGDAWIASASGDVSRVDARTGEIEPIERVPGVWRIEVGPEREPAVAFTATSGACRLDAGTCEPLSDLWIWSAETGLLGPLRSTSTWQIEAVFEGGSVLVDGEPIDFDGDDVYEGPAGERRALLLSPTGQPLTSWATSDDVGATMQPASDGRAMISAGIPRAVWLVDTLTGERERMHPEGMFVHGWDVSESGTVAVVLFAETFSSERQIWYGAI